MQTVFDELRQIVGEQNLLTDSQALVEYGVDWSKSAKPAPLAVILPESTEQVAAIMAFCHQRNISVVPSGGLTGLAGGATAADGELVLNLKRMNQILDIDDIGMTISVQAGVITQAVQEAAAAQDLYFGLDLAAKGSSQIGGNLATNAGGLKFIRYGGAREQVLGIEVVLADGTILDLNQGLRKNNVGYDLKQLFIGAEGTLGVITQATLRLVSRPKELQVAVLAVSSSQAMMDILRHVNRSKLTMTAFEFFDQKSMELVVGFHQSVRCPFVEMSPLYVLLEIEMLQGSEGVWEQFLNEVFEQEWASDGVISSNAKEFSELWSLRELISESLTMKGRVRKNDVSVPIKLMGKFLDQAASITDHHESLVQTYFFGHVGDGNVHINYVGDSSGDEKIFSTTCATIEQEVFKLVKSHSGSISAEHGIGTLKKKDLHFSRSAEAIHAMKLIKGVLDQNAILNPGKIFDL